MTNILDKNSPIKNKLIQVSDYYGLSMRKFEEKCQLGRGTISNATGAIGSDKLSKIVDNCIEIDLYWLLTGKGSMLKSESTKAVEHVSESDSVQSLRNQLKDKERIIVGLEREKELMGVIIQEKERNIQMLMTRMNGDFFPKTGTG